MDSVSDALTDKTTRITGASRRIRAIEKQLKGLYFHAGMEELDQADAEGRRPRKLEHVMGPKMMANEIEDFVRPMELVSLLESHVAKEKKRRMSNTRLTDADEEIFVQQLEQYNKFKRKLPSSLNGRLFQAINLPVVPLFKDLSAAMDPRRLERAGFKVTQVGKDGFVVLENETILAIDRKALGIKKTVMRGERFKVVRSNGAQRAREETHAQNAILEILDDLNDQFRVNFDLASNLILPCPRSPGIWLAWVVTKRKRQALEEALRTVEVSWNFPFSRTFDE
jgi:hypothetical protein